MTVDSLILICLNIVQIGQSLAINKKVGHVRPLKTRNISRNICKNVYRKVLFKSEVETEKY